MKVEQARWNESMGWEPRRPGGALGAGAQRVLLSGRTAVLARFYSCGEISPSRPARRAELHNQTMTITTFSER